MKKIGEAGQSRIEKEFNWDRIAEKTEEVYNKSLSHLNPIMRILG